MDKINLLYIDDNIDPHTSQYLNELYDYVDVEIVFTELEFKPEKDSYESLVEDTIIQEADVIIIDSKLFQNPTAADSKFSGEEFRIIIKKFFPYKEIIVITQNLTNSRYGIISKYDSHKEDSVKVFYDRELKKYLDEAINNIIIYRNISKKLQENEKVEKVLIEKIKNNLNGILEYDDFTKEDLNDLISKFEDIKEQLRHV